MKKGLFIAIEGVDGAGTTTQSRRLHGYLNGHGIEAILTREPSDGPVGSLIRQILSARVVRQLPDGSTREVDSNTTALLFAADRTDHLCAEILPGLKHGITVITDRYYHSSLAYQSIEAPLAWVREINRNAPPPDVTFLLVVPVSAALQRVAGRKGRAEMFEKRKVLEQVARNYSKLRSLLKKETIVELDGTLPEDEIFGQILSWLCRMFPSKFKALL